MRCQRRSSSASTSRSSPSTTANSSLSAVDGSGTAPARSNSTPLCTSSVASPPSSRIMFGTVAVARPRQRLVGAPPVLLERLALPGEHRDAGGGDRGGGVVLGREDVAGRPAHLGAERDERLDEHRGLDGHVQRAGDARAGERLGRAVALAQRHEAGHLVLGELDLLAAELGEREVGDLEVGELGRGRQDRRWSSWIRLLHQGWR